MTSSFPGPASRLARRGRLLSVAFMLLGGLALLLNAAGVARAQAAPSADINVTKSGDEAAPLGGTISYTLAVNNGGPDTATNVVLTDPIPAHTTFVSATSPTGTVDFSNNTVTVTFDSLTPCAGDPPVCQTGTVKLVVSVNADTPRGTVVSNTVTGTAATPDPNPDNNSATALTVVIGPFAGDLLISEFRLRGPAGATDEYVEIYNNTDSPHFVQAPDGSAGYSVAASDGVIRCTIPNSTVIPSHGHYLCVNSAGYSLASYPAGETSTATGDATYTLDIPDNAGIALFRTADVKNFNTDTRLDAVGSTSEANTLYKEGAGYPALSPLGLDYAFYRDNCGKAGSITVFGPCPTAGAPKDTNDNAVDFVFVSPDGNSSGAGARLGAPGPENLSSPIQRNSSFAVDLLDPCVSSTSPPNRVRSFTSDPANNSTFGTLDIRRTVTNHTGQDVTRLRWRIVDITTTPAPPGIADLRAMSSTPVVVTVDRAPCGTATSDVTVQGTTLEQPPLQTGGGGFNSTLSSGTVTLDTPLADSASLDVHFLLGIQQTGNFKFFVNIEALTRDAVIIIPPEETLPLKPSPGAPFGPSVRPRKGVIALPSDGEKVAPPAQAPGAVSVPPAQASKGVTAQPARPKGVSKVRRDVDSREF
ncbi:MAG: DUF11 domain-containing protein [Acidobacteria bacterium]|nr:DUF11 domain-containing protein [Acidobacteriota bacterium]